VVHRQVFDARERDSHECAGADRSDGVVHATEQREVQIAKISRQQESQNRATAVTQNLVGKAVENDSGASRAAQSCGNPGDRL
jgi:hypothetical protein